MQLGQDNTYNTSDTADAPTFDFSGDPNSSQYYDPYNAEMTAAAPSDVVDVWTGNDQQQGVYMRAQAGQAITPAEAANAGIDILKAFTTAAGTAMRFIQTRNAQGQPVYVAAPAGVSQLPPWLLPAAIVGALLLIS